MNSMDETTDVIVIGAGLAGLAAARDLTRGGLSVRLLEKSKGVSGRAATKRLQVNGQPIRADHGAQFFTVRAQRLSAILPVFLESDICFEWTRGFPRWTSGGLEPREPGHPRYACADGMSALGKAFAKGWEPNDSALEVETEVLATRIEPAPDGWDAVLENGQVRHARVLILNAPAPQAIPLVSAHVPPTLVQSLEAVRYDPCWAAIIALDERPPVDWPALEMDHPVFSWAAMDHTKRELGSPPVLVLHAQGAWSRDHLELKPETVLEMMMNAAKDALGPWVANSLASTVHRWRYAQPTALYPRPFMAHENLVLCGDWCAGSKVEGALESGWATAGYVKDRLMITQQ
jgi:renalase